MKLAGLTFALWTVSALSIAAFTEEREFRGHVTDDMCGGEHMMEGMDAKECADECVKMGAVYAVFVTADEKMYAVDDPKKLEPFAGENVLVKGTLSDDGKTLRIVSIEKAET